MSSQITISNLQSALNCSGCKCCQQMQNQIDEIKQSLSNSRIDNRFNYLESRVNSLPDENNLLRKVSQTLLPRFLSTALNGAKSIVNNSQRNIQPVDIKAIEQNILNSGALLTLIGLVVSKQVAPIVAQQTAQAGLIAGLRGSVGGLSGKVGIIGAAVAGVGASVVALNVLGGRIDAIDSRISNIESGLSKTNGQLFQLKNENNRQINILGNAIQDAENIGRLAFQQARVADVKGDNANNIAIAAGINAQKANFNAVTAYNQAIEARNEAGTAINFANNANIKSTNANNTANRALNGVTALQVKLTTEVDKLNRRMNDLFGQILAKLETQRATQERLLSTILGIKADTGAFPSLLAPVFAGLAAIPKGKEFEKKVSVGTCSTLNSPQCTASFENRINKNTDFVGRALSNQFGNLLNGLNLGANAGQLAMLKTIDQKLGAQIPGGIGGKLTKLVSWLQLDRALNLITAATTIHNAAMLSNNIGQTLGQAIGNVLQLIGIKDENGSPLNIGGIINGTVENLMKAVIGEANYVALNATWAKANRIYQASVNVLNSLQNLTNSVLNGLEITAGRVGKIGNALRSAGEVLENSYGWMNPQPKFNRLMGALEAFDNTANSIVQVTQAPLDIIQAQTELTQANTEFLNALKNDNNESNKGIAEQEPQKLTQEQQISKDISKGILTGVGDFFNAAN